MPLAALLREAGGIADLYAGSGTAEICSIEYDSRSVRKGSLFVAVEGFKSDGHAYIGAAVEKGAAAVLIARERTHDFSGLSAAGAGVLAAQDPRKALSRLSAAFYGFPSRSMMVIGVTGTNGKTSVTYMLESIMRRHGLNTGVIGTINYRWGNRSYPALNTTPESKDLQETLYRMKQDGIAVVIMEASSHALELSRANDIDFDAAVFTNLTGDHLDFHHDFESYFYAKKRLFDLLNASRKKGRCGIVNADDRYGKEIYLIKNQYAYPLKSFGVDAESDYMPEKGSVNNSIRGLSFRLERPFPGLPINLKLPGRFQLYNAIAAFAAAHQMGAAGDEITAGLEELSSVPGRFDVLTAAKGFTVIVDYAHTADALSKLLKSVNELDHRRIITVFGCGGDRDRSKRPLMGRAAEENSDLVIVTSDNPRTEDPDRIIRDIAAGITGENHEILPDREEAIARALSSAERDDIVVIAGKGHEDYQIIGTEKIHFDDKEVAARYL
ncbi:MAG: UDP-N-acetylmuramoyl-L-alanyl-D-glutamate--2,6-diaminopimelate ligase [Spirochaetes bacterium RBG_16_49_21]|nr:MAG: UDP-N-acetylmuramoyl-L-alanyl-D-glutamate--2,6-diaminopimelate ligase [Spirochaetes bacterium RBG_16_49_21]